MMVRSLPLPPFRAGPRRRILGLVAGTGLLAATLGGAPQALAQNTWVVDHGQSQLGFRATAAGESFTGTFERWEAQIDFDPVSVDGSSATITVDLASATTGSGDRDAELPKADWFDVERHPTATFQADSFRSEGDGRYVAEGNLTLKGQSHPIELPFTLVVDGSTAKVDGEATLDRSRWAIGAGSWADPGTIPNEVVVTVDLVASRQ